MDFRRRGLLNGKRRGRNRKDEKITKGKLKDRFRRQNEITPFILLQPTISLRLKTALDIWPAAEVITADLDKYKSNSSGNFSESVLVFLQITPEPF